MDLPTYSESPSQALKELLESEGLGTYSYDGRGGVTFMETVTSAEIIDLGGEKAIYTITVRNNQPLENCYISGYELFILSKSWADHVQRAAVVLGVSCINSASKYLADLQTALSTFRLIEPH